MIRHRCLPALCGVVLGVTLHSQTFQLISTPSNLTSAFELEAGDLDADGQPDLASLYIYGAATLHTWVNPGGSPAAPSVVQTPAFEAFTLADLDFDGAEDLVLTGIPTNGLSRRLSTKDGNFGPAKLWYGAGDFSNHSAVADLNQDGWLDVAMAFGDGFSSSGLAILRGTGPGDFVPNFDFKSYGVEERAAIGDLNHDGKLDVVTIAGNGSLHFFPSPAYATVPRKLSVPGLEQPAGYATPTIADMDADGDADFFVRRSSWIGGVLHSVLQVRRMEQGVPVGPIASSRIEAAVNYRDSALGDLDGDGDVDVLTNRLAGAELLYSSPKLQFSRSRGDGTFEPPVFIELPSSAGNPVILDWNSDGKADIATATGLVASSGHMCWLIQQ